MVLEIIMAKCLACCLKITEIYTSSSQSLKVNTCICIKLF